MQKKVTFPEVQDLIPVVDEIRQVGAAKINELKRIINDNSVDSETRMTAMEQLIQTYESLKAFIESDDYQYKLVPLLAELDEALEGDGVYFSNWLKGDVVEDRYGNVRGTRTNYTTPGQIALVDMKKAELYYITVLTNQQFKLQGLLKGKTVLFMLEPSLGASLHSTPIIYEGYNVILTDTANTLANYSNSKSFVLSVTPIITVGSTVYVDVFLTELKTS